MKCPNCQQEMPAGSQSCPACGSLVPPSAYAPQSVTPASSSATTLDVLFVVFSLFCWALVILLNAAATKAQYGSFTAEASGYVIGRCLGAALIPAIGLWAFVKFGGKSLSRSTKFFIVSVGTAFLSLLTAVPELSRQSTMISPEHISQLAKEAVGQAPVSPDQSVWDSPIRSYFADLKAFNDQYIQEAAALDKSALADLYSAKSFSSRESIERTLSQLQAVRDVDARHASLDPLFDKLKARVQAVKASESAKKSFWDGFEASARKSTEPRTAATEKEMKWLDNTAGLYQFTLANLDSYSVQNGKLLFRKGSGLDQEFNDKLHKALDSRKEFLDQQKIFHADQRQKLGKIGIMPEDLGVPSHKDDKSQ